MNDPFHSPPPHRPLRVVAGARGARAGFTLMELVVASALMATLMVGLWGLVSILTTLANKGTDQLQRMRGATQFFQWLENDLRSVPGTTLHGRTPLLVGSESTLELWLVSSPSLQWLGRAELQAKYQQGPMRATNQWEPLATTEGSRPSADSGRPVSTDAGATPAVPAWPAVHRVHYSYPSLRESSGDVPVGVGAPTGGRHLAGLWRYDERSAGAEPAEGDQRSAGGDERWFGTTLQFAAIEAVRFSYFDGLRWAAQWNSAAQGELPVAVQVEAWFTGGSRLSSQLADSHLATADPRSAIDTSTADPAVGNRDPADQAAPAWAEALSPLESRLVPDRRADLTRWVALQ